MLHEKYTRRSPQDSDYDIDWRGNLLYWNSTRWQYAILEPAQPIIDPEICIGKIGQQNLLPGHLSLKPKDWEQTLVTDQDGNRIGNPLPPGISVFLFFGSKSSGQNDIYSVTNGCLGRKVTPKNRLYITQIEYVIKAGWTAFFAPLINGSCSIRNPLHVMLTPNSLLSGRAVDATETEKANLASAFIRW